MPEGIFKSVYAVSSEDPNHPATNLLKIQHGKKWKIKTPGEKSAYVILQFDQSQQITGIDIGNEHSAFVEVLVGKNACSQDDFKEILITSSLMTPPESKNSTNTNRVRCFSKDSLVKSIADEKWDLVKVVCTQPFNRNVQFGLGFIRVHVAADSNNLKNEKKLVPKQFLLKNLPSSTQSSSSSLSSTSLSSAPKLKAFGSFNLREDSPDSESESSVSLFSRWKESRKLDNNSPKISTAALIRDASALSSLKKNHDNLKPMKIIQKPVNEQKSKQTKNEDKPILDRNRNDLLYNEEDEIGNEKLERKISLDKERVKKENEKLLKDDKKKKHDSTEKNGESSFSKATNKSKDGEKNEKRKDKSSIGSSSSKYNDKSEEKSTKSQDKPSIDQKPSTSTKMDNDNNNTSLFKKRPSSSIAESSPAKKTKKQKIPEYKPFNKLLEGVTLVISGIQNPDRAEIRAKALKMGAKYKSDWDNSCTHLICAFKNTPKYNQVKGHGKIITRNWIEKCYSLRKRLPWRRYAIDDKEQDKSESEDEIYDITLQTNLSPQEKPQTKSYDAEQTFIENRTMEVSSDEESDTEDELERIRNIKKHQKLQNNHSKTPEKIKESSKQLENNEISSKQNDELNVYDISTEEEDNTKLIKSKLNNSPSSSSQSSKKQFFKNLKFFIGHVGAVDKIKLINFIKQYNGEIVNSIIESNYVITKEPIDVPSKFNGEILTPLWIYECNDMECLLPTKRYKL